MNFFEQLQISIEEKNSLLCVGIDPDLKKIPHAQVAPEEFGTDALVGFCKRFIDQTVKYAAAYKPQFAYFSAFRGGEEALYQVIQHAKQTGTPVILDAKRGDIDRTSAQYAEEAFGKFEADATTVNGYMGRDVVDPYIKAFPERGLFVLGRTSNPSAGDVQDLKLANGRLVWEEVVQKAAHDWNKGGQIGIVAGATYPEDLEKVRQIVGNKVFLLVPGVGTQGGDVQKTVEAAQNNQGTGCIINSSSAIMFPKDSQKTPEDIARATWEEINKYRKVS